MSSFPWAAALLLFCAAPAFPQTATSKSEASISGTIADDTGTPISAASVTLSHGELVVDAAMLSRESGQFSFANVPARPFRLTVSAAGDMGTPVNY